MAMNDTGPNIVVLAMSRPSRLARSKENRGPNGRQRGDMRLIATPMRYKVQRWDYAHPQRIAKGWQQGTSWKDVQRMKRTQRKWVDEEFDAAGRMYERRVREYITKRGEAP